jgi:hypothetical protein
MSEPTLRALEESLGKRGYGINYTRESDGTWKCSIAHGSWWTDNLYAARVLPTGEGNCQLAALQTAMIDGELYVDISKRAVEG